MVQKKKVKQWADFTETPPEGVIRETLAQNIRYIMEANKIRTHKELAEILGIEAANISRIKNKQSFPSLYPTLIAFRRVFGYSIDTLLFSDIRFHEKVTSIRLQDSDSAKKYAGIYQVYYYRSANIGSEHATAGEALRSGVMLISPSGQKMAEAKAILGCNRKQADDYLKAAKAYGDEAEAFLEREGKKAGVHYYEGVMKMSLDQLYIELSYGENRDRLNIVLNQPHSNRPDYAGGLGAMLSVSTGSNNLPVLQYVALSCNSIPVSSDRIAGFLLMNADVKAYSDAVNRAADMLRKLYSEDEGKGLGKRLDEQEKIALIKTYTETAINESIARGQLRTIGIPIEKDYEFYLFLKEHGIVVS